MTRGRVLLVEDDAAWGELLEKSLQRREFEVRRCRTGDQALLVLGSGFDPDTVLTDLQMPGMSGIELCSRVTAMAPDVPVVVITAFGSLETAVAAIRAGAYDFVTKPVEVDALAITLERAVQHRQLSAEVKRLREVVAELQRIEGLCGRTRDAPKWAPRSMDLDILLYGDLRSDEPGLVLPRPDLLVYLHLPMERVRERIRMRGRSYEQSITADYLARLQDGYLDHLQKSSAQRTVVIDLGEADLLHDPAAFARVLELLHQPHAPGFQVASL